MAPLVGLGIVLGDGLSSSVTGHVQRLSFDALSGNSPLTLEISGSPSFSAQAHLLVSRDIPVEFQVLSSPPPPGSPIPPMPFTLNTPPEIFTRSGEPIPTHPAFSDIAVALYAFIGLVIGGVATAAGVTYHKRRTRTRKKQRSIEREEREKRASFACAAERKGELPELPSLIASTLSAPSAALFRPVDKRCEWLRQGLDSPSALSPNRPKRSTSSGIECLMSSNAPSGFKYIPKDPSPLSLHSRSIPEASLLRDTWHDGAVSMGLRLFGFSDASMSHPELLPVEPTLVPQALPPTSANDTCYDSHPSEENASPCDDMAQPEPLSTSSPSSSLSSLGNLGFSTESVESQTSTESQATDPAIASASATIVDPSLLDEELSLPMVTRDSFPEEWDVHALEMLENHIRMAVENAIEPLASHRKSLTSILHPSITSSINMSYSISSKVSMLQDGPLPPPTILISTPTDASLRTRALAAFETGSLLMETWEDDSDTDLDAEMDADAVDGHERQAWCPAPDVTRTPLSEIRQYEAVLSSPLVPITRTVARTPKKRSSVPATIVSPASPSLDSLPLSHEQEPVIATHSLCTSIPVPTRRSKPLVGKRHEAVKTTRRTGMI